MTRPHLYDYVKPLFSIDLKVNQNAPSGLRARLGMFLLKSQSIKTLPNMALSFRTQFKDMPSNTIRLIVRAHCKSSTNLAVWAKFTHHDFEAIIEHLMGLANSLAYGYIYSRIDFGLMEEPSLDLRNLITYDNYHEYELFL